MKRFALLLFALFAFFSTAQAEVKLKRIDIGWHTSLAANWYQQGDSADVNYGTAAQAADTSQTIDIRQFVLPPAIGTTSAVGDSIGWLRFSFYPKSNRTAILADSIYFAIQVSENGRDWTDTTPTRTFIATGIGAHDGLVALELGATNSFMVVVRQSYAGAASGIFLPFLSSNTEPTWLQLYGFPYMRVIVQSDITGHYDGEVVGFVSNGN